MATESRTPCPALLRIAGVVLLGAGIILTESRTGDWFFRSEIFNERFSSLLLLLRIAACLAGVLLIIAGGKLGRFIDRRWNGLSEPGKLVVVTIVLAAAGMIVFSASEYFRENIVLLETVTKYQARFKILGFSVLLQTDEMRTPDFLTAVFLAIAGTISYFMYSLYRLGSCREILEGGPKVRRMWLLFAMGFYYLAMDEYFGFHEAIGDNTPLLARVGITHHPDDLVICFYFLFALAIMTYFRRYLLRCRIAVGTLAIGIVLHALSVVADGFIDSFAIEEGLELTAIIFYTCAIAQYALAEILATRTIHADDQ